MEYVGRLGYDKEMSSDDKFKYHQPPQYFEEQFPDERSRSTVENGTPLGMSPPSSVSYFPPNASPAVPMNPETCRR
ncbi:hypothetical protein E2C01_008120 [Portunus trituberculatus]|uniref:Uncharacterized protein n=1 Tax=Portunus trituberculatus TaxID=210409 RepID=A0A5B7D331_PORTR|nr:hypothetical protein [Portunus trituberculatus]